MTITPPWAVWSPRRAAGRNPISTVADPFAIMSGGPTQVHVSVMRAAGKKPIITVGQPMMIGPPTCGFGPSDIGQVCMSVILAAGGMVHSPFYTFKSSQRKLMGRRLASS